MSLRIRAPREESGVSTPDARSRRARRARRDGRDEPFDPNLHDGNYMQDADADHYMSRLVKLIPAEALAVYPFLHSRSVEVTHDAGPGALWLPATVAWIVLLLVVLMRWQYTRMDDGTAQWGAIIIAAVSFMLWVPVLDGIPSTLEVASQFAGGIPTTVQIPGSFGIFYALDTSGLLPLHGKVQQFIPELMLALWTILIPTFYRPTG